MISDYQKQAVIKQIKKGAGNLKPAKGKKIEDYQFTKVKFLKVGGVEVF